MGAHINSAGRIWDGVLARPPTIPAIRFFVLTAAYFGGAWLSLSVAFVHGTVSPVWILSGLSIACLTLWGPGLWPAITVGAFAANFLFAVDPLPAAAGIAIGNTLEAVLGAFILRRLGVAGEVSRIRDGIAILVVVILAPLPSAACGAMSLTLAGLSPWDQYWWVWLAWWLSDFMGALLVMPLILAWCGKLSPIILPARPLEFAGALVMAVIFVSFVFLHPHALAHLGVPYLPLSSFLFLPIVWAILRLRPRQTTMVVIAACIIAVSYTVTSSEGELIGRLLWLQIVLLCIGGGSLLMVGAMAERAQAQQQSQASITKQQEALAALQVAHAQAQAANRAKSVFLAAASHDLRQPVHAIFLLVAALATRLGQHPAQCLVSKIEVSLDVLQRLLTSLLDISRLDAGVVAPEIQVVPLAEIIDRLKGEYAPRAAGSGLSLRTVHAHARIRTDPVLLERILRNLIENALRYTERGKVLVGCRRHGDSVCLHIIDTGIGIAPEHQEAVFQEFYQVGNPERDREKGLGLGLSIVKRLCGLLGHELVLVSHPGRGTRFVLSLPAVWPEAPGQAAMACADTSEGRLAEGQRLMPSRFPG